MEGVVVAVDGPVVAAAAKNGTIEGHQGVLVTLFLQVNILRMKKRRAKKVTSSYA